MQVSRWDFVERGDFFATQQTDRKVILRLHYTCQNSVLNTRAKIRTAIGTDHEPETLPSPPATLLHLQPNDASHNM